MALFLTRMGIIHHCRRALWVAKAGLVAIAGDIDGSFSRLLVILGPEVSSESGGGGNGVLAGVRAIWSSCCVCHASGRHG